MRLTNTAEGQANTTVLTDANSGNASGDAFTATTTNQTAITFSSTSPAVGARCYKVASGTGTIHLTGWDADSLGGDGYAALSAQFWFKTPDSACAGDVRICQFKNANTYGGLIWGGTDGALDNTICVMQATSALAASKSGTLSFSTWYRLELAIKSGTGGAGTYKFRIKDTSLSDVHTHSGAFTGPNADNLTTFHFGRLLTSSNFESDVYFDDITIGDSDDYLPIVDADFQRASGAWVQRDTFSRVGGAWV